MTIVRHLIRFVVAALVLMLVGYLVPNFAVYGFWNAFLAALVIALLGWGIEYFFGENVSPYNRGIVGFLVSAVVIYVTQFFIPGVRMTIIGALLAALVIGIIDLFVPIKAKFAGDNVGKTNE